MATLDLVQALKGFIELHNLGDIYTLTSFITIRDIVKPNDVLWRCILINEENTFINGNLFLSSDIELAYFDRTNNSLILTLPTEQKEIKLPCFSDKSDSKKKLSSRVIYNEPMLAMIPIILRLRALCAEFIDCTADFIAETGANDIMSIEGILCQLDSIEYIDETDINEFIKCLTKISVALPKLYQKVNILHLIEEIYDTLRRLSKTYHLELIVE